MSPLDDFFSYTPTDSEVWRAIVAFGRNSATYKFAFGRAIMNLAADGVTSATTEDLAKPFATALCEHLKHSDKQINREVGPGSFLAACRDFNAGKVDESRLMDVTSRKGFVNVIEAFQNLPGFKETRFYSGNFRSGITFHDPLLNLATCKEAPNLREEIEARWCLVESAWSLQLTPSMIKVEMDSESEILFLRDARRQRIDLSPARSALNAYQKGNCFYCGNYISVDPTGISGSHVDHFLPLALASHGVSNANGIWNLVLACATCNLPKSAQLPHVTLPKRLERRNNWYCESKHPLSETIRAQTGESAAARKAFIQAQYVRASAALGIDPSHGWLPAQVL